MTNNRVIAAGNCIPRVGGDVGEAINEVNLHCVYRLIRGKKIMQKNSRENYCTHPIVMQECFKARVALAVTNQILLVAE